MSEFKVPNINEYREKKEFNKIQTQCIQLIETVTVAAQQLEDCCRSCNKISNEEAILRLKKLTTSLIATETKAWKIRNSLRKVKEYIQERSEIGAETSTNE